MDAHTLASELEKANEEPTIGRFQRVMLILIVKALISILEKLEVPS